MADDDPIHDFYKAPNPGAHEPPPEVKYVVDEHVSIVRTALDFYYECGHDRPVLIRVGVDLERGHVDLSVQRKDATISPAFFRQPIPDGGGACVEVALRGLVEVVHRHVEMFGVGGRAESFSRSHIGACVLDVIWQIEVLRTRK
jgi:hypothetical protein